MAERIRGIVSSFFAHWKEPEEGKYIPYKEFTAYSVGGIGVNMVLALFAKHLPLTATCFLLGSVYGIRPMDLAYINIFVNVINLVKTPFVSMLIDNTNSKYGKFRPYLLYTGVPTAALIVAMAFLPTNPDPDFYTVKIVIITAMYTLLLLFQSVYDLAYKSLAQVMTPNGEERTFLLSISSFVFNLGPSIIDIFFPLLAGIVAAGLLDVRAYRILFPIFGVFGLLLSLWVFTSTKEKIIVPKTYVAKVRFFDGLKQVVGNKYFWQVNLFHILGALKSGIQGILPWFFVYAMREEAMLGIANALMGTAFIPGMLLSPWLAKKLRGKRNVLIIANALHVLFTATMLLSIHSNVVWLFITLYLSNMMVGTDGVMTQSMLADVFDYQQWRTGKRYEGFISNFGGMLVTLCASLSGLIMPYLFEARGLENNYNVLFEAQVRTPIFNVMVWSSVISGVLCILPLLFYDMTEQRQQQYVRELKERAQET